MNTIEVKTSELIGPALDWAVAKCEGWKYNDRAKLKEFQMQQLSSAKHCYSTVWAKGGPIIERKRIGVKYTGNALEFVSWRNGLRSIKYDKYGPTPLIAAMRCYVASKLGDTVEIPKELVP